MAQVIIRNLDPAVVSAIKASAALNGRSMEAELRALVENAVAGKKAGRDRRALAARLRKLAVKMPPRISSTDILRRIRNES